MRLGPCMVCERHIARESRSASEGEHPMLETLVKQSMDGVGDSSMQARHQHDRRIPTNAVGCPAVRDGISVQNLDKSNVL